MEQKVNYRGQYGVKLSRTKHVITLKDNKSNGRNILGVSGKVLKEYVLTHLTKTN